MVDDVNIINTDINAKDGQNKCPKCGATDISQNTKSGKLRCNFCRYEFEPESSHTINADISTLVGEEIGSGITDIDREIATAVTLKCESCGAEVVIDTSDSVNARCHWCRNSLSINKQTKSGSIPDAILPFKLQRAEARLTIEKFVKKRRFYAHPKFIKEFTTENIMGVYFPYMTVDVNAHTSLKGQGEVLVRKYSSRSGDKKKTYYDADLYDVSREFDILINDLTIESNQERLNHVGGIKTNNIINAVMPFDVENCVGWDANYLKGFTSEKRNVDIDYVRNIVKEQSKDIARFKANESLKKYNRGVKWSSEDFSIIGQRWHAIYLPVWLYSYQQKKSGNNSLIHYVAVNARTNEVMGSVPLHIPKLLFVSLIVEILGVILAILFVNDDNAGNLLFLLSGILFFLFYYKKYRNTDARHQHEVDTESKLGNLQSYDQHIKLLTGLRSSKMKGANNKRVNGTKVNDSMFDSVVEQVGLDDILDNFK